MAPYITINIRLDSIRLDELNGEGRTFDTLPVPVRRACFPAGGDAARRLAGACAWTVPPPGAEAAGARPRGARRPRARPSPTCASAARGPARAAAVARVAAPSRARTCAGHRAALVI